MRISDWSSDVCSSDLHQHGCGGHEYGVRRMFDRHHPRIGNVQHFPARTEDVEPCRLVVAGQEFEPAETPVMDAVFLQDRKSVVEGKGVSVRVDFGGRRIITKKK